MRSHTSLYSVTICPVKIQMCSARHAEDKTRSDKLSWEQTLSLDTTDTCFVHKSKTNGDSASRATTTQTDPLHQACSTNREKNNKDGATRQQAGRNNLVNVGQQTNLITLLDLCVSCQHSPNTVTRLSHNSMSHGGRCKYVCCRMFISTKTIVTLLERKKHLCQSNACTKRSAQVPSGSRV